MTLPAGMRLGPYEILGTLGAGGMGEVYRARDTRLGREVAVKVLSERFSGDAELTRRFEQEARSVAALSHPNILTLYDFAREGERLYAVSELLEGETLRTRLSHSPPGWQKAVDIAVAVADGLAAAHARGIVHRDLKPENIFLTSDGRVKILDFGLARWTPPATGTRSDETSAPTVAGGTEPGYVMGTVGYMSPEQVKGETAETTSDLFSLGCVLSEAVSGRKAFARKTSAETLASILRDPAPDLAAIDPALPRDLCRTIAHCLEKEPGERFQSARDLAFALRAVQSAAASPRVSSGSARRMIESIAVLPLASAVGDEDAEFLADGITEALIMRLSRLSGLRVIARTSAFRYKGADVDPIAAGRTLGVGGVVTGRVIHRGDTIVVRVELVDLADESQLWGEQFRRKADDVLAIENEIAAQISENLRVKLTGEEKERLTRTHTESPEANRLYLKGRYFWGKRNEDAIRKGIEHFRQAIEIDPAYAVAYVGIADSYAVLGFHSIAPPGEAFPLAKAAALKALELDPSLAEARAPLAYAMHHYEWKWKEAEEEYQRCLEAIPHYPTAHNYYASMLTQLGRFEEAFREWKRGQELDPLSLVIRAATGWCYYYARRYDESLREASKALEMDPTFVIALRDLGLVYAHTSRPEEAVQQFRKAVEFSGGGTAYHAELANALAKAGRADEARRELAALEQIAKTRYVSPYYVGTAHLALGERDRTFEYLQRALEERAHGLTYMRLDPDLDEVRSDPRYADLVRRVGIPMTLAAGARLGPYEIVSPLGAGGMGEVYRAKDTRLGREVAVKVLPASLSQDPDRLRRFEQEARAASALNHPNIITLHDVGQHDGAPYVVTELLEGETLRERLVNGALSPRKTIDYAIQIAQGLAAAHSKKIVHRDLKPENLFVTVDGRVKILDFGLAKLIRQEDFVLSSGATTMTTLTRPDSIVGTVGYMSPEQVCGQNVDGRSDIFSFGVVLYEALSGRRAFLGASVADTMSAILHEDPPELALANSAVSPGVERVVRHCIEKDCELRFQSARDLAFDLEGLALSSGWDRMSANHARVSGSGNCPTYRRLTFRRGTIPTARFSPDEQTVLCCARWEGAPLETFALRLDSPESRPLGLPEARLLSVSTSGELAVVLNAQRAVGAPTGGALATIPLAGGAPRERLESVKWADWLPNGSNLAVVRAVDGRDRLEFPIDCPVYEPTGWIAFIRVSPRGDLVAFMDYPVGGTTGSVAIVDRAGRVRRLSGVWSNARGLAWSPDGEEVWFTATNSGFSRALHAVTLEGRERLVEAVPGGLFLHDISRSGKILLSHDQIRSGILCRIEGQQSERELSWFDYSAGPDLSSDGQEILFSEGGEGGGQQLSTYLRRTDGAPAVRLGDGEALALSPDGKWAVSRPLSLDRLLLIPTRAGQTREVFHEGFVYRHAAAWFPDGNRFLYAGNPAGQSPRSYVYDLDRASTSPVTPEGIIATVVSPDGRYVAGDHPTPQQYPVEGGSSIPIAGALRGDVLIRWHRDGRSMFVRSGFLPAKIFRIDLPTGAREPYLELIPTDPAGIAAIDSVTLTPDARSYAYSYMWMRSDLYTVEGLA